MIFMLNPKNNLKNLQLENPLIVSENPQKNCYRRGWYEWAEIEWRETRDTDTFQQYEVGTLNIYGHSRALPIFLSLS